MKYVKCLFTESTVFIKCKFIIILKYVLLPGTYVCSYCKSQDYGYKYISNWTNPCVCITIIRMMMFILKIMGLFVLTGDSLRRHIRNKPLWSWTHSGKSIFNMWQLGRSAFQMRKWDKQICRFFFLNLWHSLLV